MDNVCLLDDVQAADVLGLAPATLRKWRCQGGGPAFFRLGRLIRYRRDEIEAWLESRRVENTSQYEKQINKGVDHA